MSAQPWKVYNKAKKKIGNGTISMAGAAFRLSLVQSASNFATLTLSGYASLTNEVASGNGYSSSGKALTGCVWTVGASAGQMKFDCDNPTWTASGGSIPNIKAAVLWTGVHVVGFASLTATQFTLGIGGTLTLLINPAGVLTLE